MMRRLPISILTAIFLVAAVQAQQPAATQPVATPPAAATSGDSPSFRWRSPTGETRPAAITASAASANGGMAPISGAPRAPVARVTSGTGSLPNQDGQVWREYDISPYTARVTSTNRPEQAIIDWILRETGYETWHSGVVSVLAADGRTLRVYHTPEVQAVVGEVVDRFVGSQGESQPVFVRVCSVGSPNWRVRAQPVLRPVPVQTQGIQAWLMAREDASLLAAELRKRSDHRELSAPQMYIAAGQSAVVSLMHPRQYTADVVTRPDVWPGFETKPAVFDEGLSIEISPLASLDGRSLDSVIKVNIDQLEKLQSIAVETPSTTAPRQRANIDVPQVGQFRLHDRFRWPVDQVLLVSMGIVPIPTGGENNIGGVKLPSMLSGGPERGELLVFIATGTRGSAPAVLPATTPTAATPAPATTPAAATTPAVTPTPAAQPGAPAAAFNPFATSSPQPSRGNPFAPLSGLGAMFAPSSAPMTPAATVGGLPNVPLAPSRQRY